MGRLTISEGLLGENPRAGAVILAHELQHALDSQRVALDLLELDCIALAVRGFVAQAIVTRLL